MTTLTTASVVPLVEAVTVVPEIETRGAVSKAMAESSEKVSVPDVAWTIVTVAWPAWMMALEGSERLMLKNFLSASAGAALTVTATV